MLNPDRITACGAPKTTPVQQIIIVIATPQPVGLDKNDKIVYHNLDGVTTVFVPDTHTPIVCIYVESLKTAQQVHEYTDHTWAVPNVYTSGLSCVLLNETQFDNWTERYPTQ